MLAGRVFFSLRSADESAIVQILPRTDHQRAVKLPQ
jgi:hypothetical protein